MGLCDCNCYGDDNDYEDDYGGDNYDDQYNYTAQDDDDDDDGNGDGDDAHYGHCLSSSIRHIIHARAQTKTHDYCEEAMDLAQSAVSRISAPYIFSSPFSCPCLPSLCMLMPTAAKQRGKKSLLTMDFIKTMNVQNGKAFQTDFQFFR